MLNELYDLSKGIKSLGIRTDSWHPYLKECPRSGRTFGVYIDDAGAIQFIRQIDDQQVASLRKYEKSAGNSFPTLNLLPLWCIADPDKQRRKEFANRLVGFRKSLTSKSPPTKSEISLALDEFICLCRPLWVDPNKKTRGRDESDKVNNCLGTVISEIESKLGENPNTYPLRSLLARLRPINATVLHRQLSDFLRNQLVSGNSNSVAFFDLLISSSEKPKSSSFMFEISDPQNFLRPVNHNDTYRAWSEALFAGETESKKSTKKKGSANKDTSKLVSDAYGEFGEGYDQSFPQVKMSRFGNINLRALSSESPCQRRYGKADAESFIVSSSIRQDMKNALEWLSRDERQGKTWRDLTYENGGVPTVLFAYLSRLQELPPEIADFLGGDSNSDASTTQKDFEAVASSLVDAVRGINDLNPCDDVCVFVLTKPDGYRCKVHYSSRFSSSHLLASAAAWEEGCRNLPSIQIRQFIIEKVGKSAKTTLINPMVPFPLQVMGCLSTVWRRLGTESSPTKSVHISDALSLLLDSGKELETTASALLRLLLQNSKSLILATGQAATLGKVHTVTKNMQKHQLFLPSILGLLLSKLGLSKEMYMKTGAFWVGRFLSAIDQLHCLYCEDVRGGSFPPQFVGNAMMSAALTNPENALSQLAERTKPYVAWAKTKNSGEKMKLAKYWLGQLATISNEISKQSIPNRCTDADRAAMLIGYLSRPEKENKESESDE